MSGSLESFPITSVELVCWLCSNRCLPIWSRLNRSNASGYCRKLSISKFKNYEIEIESCLWSLWGTLHPGAPVFSLPTRGRQFLACCVLACCAASVYQLMEWNSQLLDSIVVDGDTYFGESIKTIKQRDYNFSLEDLNIECKLRLRFIVHIEHVVFGRLYQQPRRNRLNLAKALIYFFSHYRYGILQMPSLGRALAVGFTPHGYFMFDCQSIGSPLFAQGQGASYLLRTHKLQVLLYCIVVTLNVSGFNEEFTLHKVEMVPKDKMSQNKTDRRS